MPIDNTEYELKMLEINSHITNDSLRNRIKDLEEKIEYSDAYDSCIQYREDIRICVYLLSIRKEHGEIV